MRKLDAFIDNFNLISTSTSNNICELNGKKM